MNKNGTEDELIRKILSKLGTHPKHKEIDVKKLFLNAEKENHKHHDLNSDSEREAIELFQIQDQQPDSQDDSQLDSQQDSQLDSQQDQIKGNQVRSILTKKIQPNQQAEMIDEKSNSSQGSQRLDSEKQEQSRIQLEQPSNQKENKSNQKKKSVSFDENIISMDISRKWKDPVMNQKKGKFDPEQQKVLMNTVGQFLAGNELTYNDFVSYISCKDGEKGIFRRQKLYSLLATLLPERSPEACYKFIMRNFNDLNHKGKWCQQEVQQLVSLVAKYGRKWKRIASEMNRTRDNIYDKYRSLGEENLEERVDNMWHFQDLVAFLIQIEKTTHLEFIDHNIKKQLEHADQHDQIQKHQLLTKKYNTKKFIFHNVEVIRPYINGKVIQQIKHQDIRWSKISNKIKTKSTFDCRNKFIQLLQIFYKNSRVNYDPEIVEFLIQERVIDESKINWKHWQHDDCTLEEARNRFMILKKMVEGRAIKSFKIILEELKKKIIKKEKREE